MPRKTTILKHLQELDKEELIGEIEKLCDKFDIVRKYFEIELSGDAGRYVEAARKDITKQFYYANGSPRRNPKASRLNAIIREFERVSIYKSDVIELLLHRIRETMAYADRVNGVSDALFASTNLVMDRVLQLIRDEGLEEQYAEQTRRFAAR